MAHENSIWTCSWGIREKSKPASEETNPDENKENTDNENEAADKETPAKPVEKEDFIVTGGLDDCVKIWNVNDNKMSLAHSLEGHSLGIVSVDVSSSGKSKYLVDL